MTDSGIVASVLDLLARIDESLLQTKETTPAVLTAVGAEIVDAIERSTQRVEKAVQTLSEQLTGELSALQARVSETTARVVELSDRSSALQRDFLARMEVLEAGRINLRDAIQQLDSELSGMRDHED